MCRAGLLRRGQRARRWVGVRVHSCDLGPRTMSSPFGGAVKGLETDSDLRCASRGVLSRVDVHDRCAGLVQSRVRGGVLALPHAARLRALGSLRPAPYRVRRALRRAGASPTTGERCDGPRLSRRLPVVTRFCVPRVSRPCPDRAVLPRSRSAGRGETAETRQNRSSSVAVLHRTLINSGDGRSAGQGTSRMSGESIYVIRLMRHLKDMLHAQRLYT